MWLWMKIQLFCNVSIFIHFSSYFFTFEANILIIVYIKTFSFYKQYDLKLNFLIILHFFL